jgi:hypothetical protein
MPWRAAAYGFLRDAVVLSDDAGQFDVGQHALCWVHAERRECLKFRVWPVGYNDTVMPWPG